MKFILSTLLVCIFSIPLLGQKNLTLSGILLEDNTEKAPVEQATIRLLSLPDSTMVTGTTTSKTGSFMLRGLSTGNYLIHVSYVGYQNLYKKVTLNGESTNLNVGNLLFKTDDILLSEATVVGKANEIVVNNDTIEYNAASYKTEDNAVVEDLLKKLPGVEVDKDGKITVGGKEIKKILIDGKEFFSDDPKVASKNLPVSMIEKLQVLDQKSDMAKLTGFEDGDEQTVINLTVKPGMKKGLVGNAAAGIGHDMESDGDIRYEFGGMANRMLENDRYTLMLSGNNTNNMGASELGGSRFGGMRGMRRGGSAGINTSEMFAFNMNKEFSSKLLLNGDVNYNSSDRDVLSNTNRTTTYKNKGSNDIQSLIEKTDKKVNDVSDNFGFNFRLEWKPDSNNTVIFRPYANYNSSSSTEAQQYISIDGLTNDTISEGPSASYNKGSGYSFGGTLEYARQFNKQGRVFSVSLTGGYNTSESQETFDWMRRRFDSGVYNPLQDSIVHQRSENDNKVNNYRIYASYVEPLGNNYFLQFAYRISQSKTKSVNSTYDLDMFDRNLYAVLMDTATLNPSQSRSTVRDAVEQRFGLNFKSMREKYNYTIGLNVDPSVSTNKTYQPSMGNVTTEYLTSDFDGHLPNAIGDSLFTPVPHIDVVNFSPTVNFNYLFGKRTNLRIDYSGSTVQPSANQLRDYTDYSDPQNLVTGNPELEPGYENSFSARFDKFVPETQLFYNFRLRGNMSFNDIGSVVTIDSSRVRHTTYANINGNWDVNFLGMFNTPLRNKRFSVNDFFMTSYANQRSYSNELLNTMTTLRITNRMGGNYRSDLFDLGLNVSLTYANSVNEVQPENNQNTYDLGLMGTTTWYLPHNFSINTDITWNGKRGYSAGFNKDETIWNASVTKQIFNKKFGTGNLRLKIYDILQDRKSISRSVGTNYVQDTESNSLRSFFMCSFIYQFNIFANGASAPKQDEFRGPREYRGDGGGDRPRSF